MQMTVLTMFPQLFNGFLESPVLMRAQRNGELDLSIVDIKDYADGSFRKIDDSPYGGGPGMVIRVDTLHGALESATSKANPDGGTDSHRSDLHRPHSHRSHVVMLSPKGSPYTQTKAREFAAMDDIVLVCGHYEGIDARFERYVDEQVSLGDFIMTGGELAAMAVVDSVSRLLDGSLREGSATDESFGLNGELLLEYPQYTHPLEFAGDRVPKVLLSGDQRAISKWKMVQSIMETVKNRPDLLDKAIAANTIGQSKARIFMYETPDALDGVVLKVEPASSCSSREHDALKWLGGRAPVPTVLGHHVSCGSHSYSYDGDGACGTSYILMSKLKGRMLCDVSFLSNRRRLLKTAAAALETLWSIDVSDCPLGSGLDMDLELASFNVGHGLVTLPSKSGCGYDYPNEVVTAEDLLAWLVENRPVVDDDVVFSHGDLCLPNVFASCKGIMGFIDLGHAGVADRWRDISAIIGSLRANLVGRYATANAAAMGLPDNEPLPFGPFDDSEFFSVLGIEPDEGRLRYYALLNELL